MKKICLGIIIFIVTIVYFNENAITTYAENYNKLLLSEGEIYKSGDIINLQKNPEHADGKYPYQYSITHIKMKDGYLKDPNYNKSDYWNYAEDSFNVYTEWQDTTFTFAKYNEQDIFWKVVNVDYSSYYNNMSADVISLDYNEPILEVKCDDKSIKENETINCNLNLKYIYDVKELKFNLNHENFEISNFKTLNSWKNNTEDNNYYLVNESTIDSNEKDLTTKVIASFSLKANSIEKTTNFKDNIYADNIKYVDVLTSRNTNPTKTTLNIEKENIIETPETPEIPEIKEDIPEEKKEEVEEIANPETGYKNIIYGFIFLIIIGSILLAISKKYKLFQKL